MLQVPNLQADLAQMEQNLKKQQSFRDQKRKEVVNAQQTIQQLEKNTPSVYDGFDRDITNLAKDIKTDGRIRQEAFGGLSECTSSY